MALESVKGVHTGYEVDATYRRGGNHEVKVECMCRFEDHIVGRVSVRTYIIVIQYQVSIHPSGTMG